MRYGNRPRLWLWLSALAFAALAILPEIPGVHGSGVVPYLFSLLLSPVGLAMDPSAGIEMLSDGILGVAFYIALALMVGWVLHCGVVILIAMLHGVESLKPPAEPVEPGNRRPAPRQ